MKHFLLVLALAATALGTSSCKKDDPTTPEPSLLGRWTGVSSHDVVTTTSSGQVISDNTTPARAGYAIEFTATELIVYNGTTVNKRSTYTRNGNTITDTSPSADPNETSTIQTLDANRLVVVDVIRSTPTSTQTTTSTITYSR